MRARAFTLTPLLLAACAPAPPPAEPQPVVPVPVTPPAQQPDAVAAPPPATAEPLIEPAGPMPAAEAERYVVALVDRDRAAHGLPPLRWDETAARAARRHARDLLSHGVTSHVGTDGSVPEQRYTEAGGAAMVWENVACFADGEARTPDAEARFYPDNLADIERAFMDETPPRDGHRKNLLGSRHTAIGVGLAAERISRYACLVEELVDEHGTFAPLPRSVWAGRRVEVEGTLQPPLRVLAVGVSRADLGTPRTAASLRPTREYPIPSPSLVCQPRGYGTPCVLEIDGAQRGFRAVVPLGAAGERGRYGVSVWAAFPGSSEPALVSLRTIEAY
jgi:uncharacterized protein YkwD